ncbi:MAG: hypothetical protein HQL95_01365 [Magnetococcales bacterium]|nr:hypothetical protein [Magnetococcales bacterium]
MEKFLIFGRIDPDQNRVGWGFWDRPGMIGSIVSATLSQAEQDYAWSGSLEVTNPASFQKIQINDPIELELGGELYKLVVDNTRISEPLLSTDDANRSRGRTQIGAVRHSREVSLTCLHRRIYTRADCQSA